MRKLVPILVVLFLLGIWNWTGGAGTWITGPTSTDYSSGVIPTGSVVYNDINEFKTAFNGGIGDTNIMESAEIDLDKLEEGVLYHAEGNTAPKKIAYGDLNMHWAATDTLVPLAVNVFGIVFADSSDVGDPGFGATPHITLGPLSIAESAVGLGDSATYHDYTSWRIAIADSFTYFLQFANAGTCSVYTHYTGQDTIFNGLQLFWEAKQK